MDTLFYIDIANKENFNADFHSVQFSERAEFCDRFLMKCVQSAYIQFLFNHISHTQHNNCTYVQIVDLQMGRDSNIYTYNGPKPWA